MAEDIQKQVKIVTTFVTAGFKKLNDSVRQYETRISKLNSSQKRFRGEFMSLMFAGLALSRIFGGIVGEMFTMFGISEMLTAFFMTALIPVMDTLSSILFPILEWFLNLPEPVQTAIGWFMLLVTALGVLLFVIGGVVLGVVGFMAVLSGLGISFGVFLSILGTISLVIVGLGLIVYGLILVFRNWGDDTGKVVKGIGLVILGLGAILFLFIGWWALIPVAVGLALAYVGTHWDKFKGVLMPILEVIKTAIYELFIDPVVEAINIIKQLIQAAKNLFSGNFSEAFGNLKGAGKSFMSGMLPGFADGGVIPGPVGKPTPVIAHGGETVIPVGGRAGNFNISQNIVVTVSDRREFENMLRENNQKLTEDIRRLARA